MNPTCTNPSYPSHPFLSSGEKEVLTGVPESQFHPNCATGIGPARVARVARQDAGDPLATALLTRFDASIVDRTVERAAILEHDAGMPLDAAEAMATDLYVATDLDAWPAPVIAELGRTGYARCVRSDGREYRRLDAEWFGYLAGLVARAEAVAARLPADDLATMRARWARITRYAALTGLLPVPAAATLSDKSRP